jgi:hypothetical protein
MYFAKTQAPVPAQTQSITSICTLLPLTPKIPFTWLNETIL